MTTRSVGRRGAAAAVIAAMALVVMAVGAGALDNGWIEMQDAPAPAGSDVEFAGIASPAPGTAIAVGHRFEIIGGFFEFRSWIERYDGSQWTVMPSATNEREPFRTFLYGADAASANDVWAVGADVPVGGLGHSVIEHYNGTAWSVVTSPAPGLTSSLASVAVHASNDAWAVGVADRPLVVHWDGTAWTQSPFPATPVAGCTSPTYLTGVSDVPTGSGAYVVGYCDSGFGQGFIARLDAHRRWRVVSAPIPASSQLRSVYARRANDVWAVGFERPASDQQVNLVMHFDGVAWTRVTVPSTGFTGLNSVFASGASDVWAVGTGESPQPPFAGPAALHFDGTQWTEVSPGGFGALLGVVGTAGKTYAVGSRLGDGVIFQH